MGRRGDGTGALYVCTQNAPAEAARFSHEARSAGAQPCSVLKVDGRTGKVLWHAPKSEDCYAAGGAVYAVRDVINPNEAVDAAFTRKAPTTRFKVFKLSSGSGKLQWQYLQLRRSGKSSPKAAKSRWCLRTNSRRCLRWRCRGRASAAVAPGYDRVLRCLGVRTRVRASMGT